MLWTLTSTFRVSTYMLHAQSAHLLSRATDPGTLDCTASPNGLLSLALRTTLWRPCLTQTAPTPPLHTPKKHAVGPETHQNLTPRPHHFRSAHVHAPPPPGICPRLCPPRVSFGRRLAAAGRDDYPSPVVITITVTVPGPSPSPSPMVTVAGPRGRGQPEPGPVTVTGFVGVKFSRYWRS